MKRSGEALDPSSSAQQPSGSKETQHAQHTQRQPSISKETQTVMPFPQRLQISVPIHCATVKAVTTELSDNPERIPQDDETWLTLAVSIRDSSSGVPLSCVVALQGEELTTPKGQMICFLSLKIDVVGDDQSQMNFPQARNPKAAYFIQRHTKSKCTPNGKATFQVCFFLADANYIISLNIHSVYDEDGLECIGYTVEHYTGFVWTVKTVERNAFKAPPLLNYEGKLVSKKFHKLMSLYTQMFYQGKKEDSSMIMSRVTSSDSTNLDIRLYMLIYKASERPFDVQTITQLEELFQKSHSLDNQNGFLLQADAMMALSQTYSFQGRTEKSLECIRHSRSLCFEVAPSHLTSCVFFNDARILISMHKGNMTPSIKRRILELLDRSIADSYYGTGWQRLMIFQTHVFKAMFCLNGVLDLHVTSPGNYTPTEEDISIAEQHLNAAPLELVSEIHMNKVIYYAALSDLNRWKENTKRAREYAEMAKQLCVEKGFFANVIQSLEARLKQLEPDTIDEILETYKDQV